MSALTSSGSEIIHASLSNLQDPICQSMDQDWQTQFEIDRTIAIIADHGYKRVLYIHFCNFIDCIAISR